MTAPSTPSLVATRINHVRREPVDHRFAHRSLSWFVDIDELPELPRALRWAARFRAADHFPQPAQSGDTLRSRLDSHLDDVGVARPTGAVTALLSPRVAGYVFNPLTVFWCHDAAGALQYVVAEVHNTYGGRHCYLVRTDAAGRAEVEKEFYVSPFNDVSGRYRLALPEPDPAGRVRLSVILDRPGQAPFTATLVGRTRAATVGAVITAQLTAPLAPWLVAARIRIHGVWLWARGLRIVDRPADPIPADPPHALRRPKDS
ncbi:DUF1365 domain-containing protein [Gordonia sp. PS3]|uniref:DUF1365 domain-containing protein n=1 Tax=Gordonia neofelifaecis NRRL B-59395 TaxID=644548 RepID=F1YM14_9ACTN|nr:MULTISPECIES: DUF1365 domain-containing protein [Gordonia]EGD54265.1 hypothetical protein SCNU_14791 [Gordonia neofelifaecis NRRL B-59395]